MDEESLREAITKINDIKSRLEAGDESALEKVQGFGNTMETVVKNLEEMLLSLEKSKSKVKELDAKFENEESCSLYPDFSDMRLKRLVIGDDKGERVYARWVKDHVEFFIGGWRDEFKNWFWFLHFLNHEIMHGVIDKVLLEDGLSEGDSHYPFLAGMDELFGLCMSHSNPEHYLPIEVFVEECKAFGNQNLTSLMKFIQDLFT